MMFCLYAMKNGKLDNLKPNIIFDYDYIAGDCFFIGDDYENADFKSITDEQIKEVSKMIEKISVKYSSSKRYEER